MNENNDPQTQELADALDALEDLLETPIVPGEMAGWCKRLQAAFETLREVYVEKTRPGHQQQLAEMSDEDAEMTSRVSQLTEEDEAIIVEFERLGALLQVLLQNLDEKEEESDDAGTHERREEIVQEMLKLVIRIRTFEKALQTWFIEAFQRDRGVVD